METVKKIKDLVEKMSVDTQKVFEKGNHSASIRSRKYAQEIKRLLNIHRKEILNEDKRHAVINEPKKKKRRELSELKMRLKKEAKHDK